MCRLFLLALFLYIVTGQPPVLWNNTYFFLRVAGNDGIPAYNFWLPSNTSHVYSVYLRQFFEATNNLQKFAPSNIDLAALDWTYGAVEGDGDMVHFNLTATNAPARFSTLTLVNHIYANHSSTEEGGRMITPLVKFDVLLDDYSWASADGDAKLVLLFDLTSPGQSGYPDPTAVDGKILVDGAFFGSTVAASSWTNPSDPTSIPVSIMVHSEGGADGIWLVYDHFTGNHLVHDPAMGLDEPETTNVLVIVLPIVFGVLLVVLIVGYIMFRRRQNYQSI